MLALQSQHGILGTACKTACSRAGEAREGKKCSRVTGLPLDDILIECIHHKPDPGSNWLLV